VRLSSCKACCVDDLSGPRHIYTCLVFFTNAAHTDGGSQRRSNKRKDGGASGAKPERAHRVLAVDASVMIEARVRVLSGCACACECA
jgi:hypothetical protein